MCFGDSFPRVGENVVSAEASVYKGKYSIKH